MALEEKCAEIRSNVIAKLEEYAGEMIDYLRILDGIVGECSGCAEVDKKTASAIRV